VLPAAPSHISEESLTPPAQTNAAAEHHSVYCPNCSHRLHGHRCKLICAHCGYYLSCADYY